MARWASNRPIAVLAPAHARTTSGLASGLSALSRLLLRLDQTGRLYGAGQPLVVLHDPPDGRIGG
jgi:hypothetical protein